MGTAEYATFYRGASRLEDEDGYVFRVFEDLLPHSDIRSRLSLTSLF
jgi:hypothetical protein